MQTLFKKSIIGGLSFLLLTGIAFSVGSSEASIFQGEAVENRIVIRNNTFAGTAASILPYTHSNYTAYFSVLTRVNLNHVVTLPVGNLTTGNTNNLPTNPALIAKIYVTISAFGNSNTVSPIYTVQATNNLGNNITGVSHTIQLANKSVSSSGDAITYAEANTKEFALVSPGELIEGFKITYSSNTTGTAPGSVLYRVKVEYVAKTQQEVDAETFSTDFLLATENKVNCTTDTGWSELATDFGLLSSEAQTEFRTNSTNQTIMDAKARYDYLISYNELLTDFVNVA